MHVFIGRGLYGVHAPAWSVPEIAQSILAFRMPVFGQCFHFHDFFSQPHACLGILPAMAYHSFTFCALHGADRVEPKVHYLDNRSFAGRWFCLVLDYSGPALSMDGLEPSPSAFRLCWYYL